MASGGAVQGLAAAAVGLAIGLMIGGIVPRGQIRDLEEQLANAEECAPATSQVGKQLAEALSGKPWEGALDERERRNLDRAVDDREAHADPEIRIEDDRVMVGEEEWDPDEFDPEDREDVEQGIEIAKTGMALRSAQARQALGEQADLTDEQWAEFDAAVNDMNAELMDISQQFVDTIASGGEPTRRDAMIFGADVLDVFLEADDRIYDMMDADQRSATEAEAMDPMAFMDPDLLDVFLELDR